MLFQICTKIHKNFSLNKRCTSVIENTYRFYNWCKAQLQKSSNISVSPLLKLYKSSPVHIKLKIQSAPAERNTHSLQIYENMS